MVLGNNAKEATSTSGGQILFSNTILQWEDPELLEKLSGSRAGRANIQDEPEAPENKRGPKEYKMKQNLLSFVGTWSQMKELLMTKAGRL